MVSQSTAMSSVDSGFPSDSDLLSTAHSSSYNSFGSQNGDAASNGGGVGLGLVAALNTPSGRNSSSAASGDILRMVLEEDEEEEEEEEEREEMGRPDVLTINAAVQTGGVMERHRLWSASVFLRVGSAPRTHSSMDDTDTIGRDEGVVYHFVRMVYHFVERGAYTMQTFQNTSSWPNQGH